MWKRLNSNQMCKQFSYKEVFLIKRFLIERFYCILINNGYLNIKMSNYFALFIKCFILSNYFHHNK